MNSESDWKPADQIERVRAIDILRGLALFGVLIVNILSGFRVPLLEHIRRHYADVQGLDYLVELLVAYALEFKALTIFSFLFGAGIAIQNDRAQSRGISSRKFLFRRLAFLFVLGAAHLFLIWNGDILTLYAICGLFLLPVVGLSWPMLALLGGALIILPEFVSFGLHLPSGPAALADIAQARQVYGNEGFLAILRFRWHETWSLIIPVLVSVLPRTIGLMYWGVAAWRTGILRAPERHRGKLSGALAIGGVIGGVITANDVWAASSGYPLWPALRNTHVDASILLALAYVSGFLLWLIPSRTVRLPGLAAIGRMALTNYLVQSIVLGFVFYGYGFGLFGRIGSAAAAGIGVTIYVIQIQLSRLWLRHFSFGPVEWLWRSLAYGRRQPVRQARLNPATSTEVNLNMNWLIGRRLPRRTGIALQLAEFAVAAALVPWALSLLGARHGWVGGEGPGLTNLSGLIPVAAGFFVFCWCSREHYLAAPAGWLLEKTPHYPTPSYLLTKGPYRYSCNPIYLAELAILLGWIVFYGSLVLAGIVAAVAVVAGPLILPREERGLEVRFGDAYREFRRSTPRWLGKVRR